MTDDSGRLDRGLPIPLFSDQIPPAISLLGVGGDAQLEWSWDGEEEKHRKEENLLDDFIKLDGAAPEEILAFAQERGVLYYCPEHWQIDCPSWGCPSRNSEPLWVWYGLVKKVRALLKIAGAIRQDLPGDEQDWLDIFRDVGLQFTEQPAGRPPAADISWEKQNLVYEVSDLLELASVGIKLTWEGERTNVNLAGKGLLGALSVQLAFAVGATAGVSVCTGCGRPYLPNRKPAIGRRNYCDQCRESGIPHRYASREYMRRRRES